MTDDQHCLTCAAPVSEYDDGRWHHVLGADDPEGLIDLVAREHDHDAEPCASRCDAWYLTHGGRDMHKRSVEPWGELAHELAELTEDDDVRRAVFQYRGATAALQLGLDPLDPELPMDPTGLDAHERHDGLDA